MVNDWFQNLLKIIFEINCLQDGKIVVYLKNTLNY